MNLDDCSTDELIQELARRFDSLSVVGLLDTNCMVALEGDPDKWMLLNVTLGSAIVTAANEDDDENYDN